MSILKENLEKIHEYYNRFLNKVPTKDVNERINSRKAEVIGDYVGELVELTNSTANDAEIIAEGIYQGIAKSHRYLQGEFWIVMEKVIRKYQDAPSDPRNQFAKDMCRAMIKGNDERLS